MMDVRNLRTSEAKRPEDLTQVRPVQVSSQVVPVRSFLPLQALLALSGDLTQQGAHPGVTFLVTLDSVLVRCRVETKQGGEAVLSAESCCKMQSRKGRYFSICVRCAASLTVYELLMVAISLAVPANGRCRPYLWLQVSQDNPCV